MATAVNITCANCFNQRAQVPAGCTHLHSTEQSEDTALRKGFGLQWMGLTKTQANAVYHQGFWLPQRPYKCMKTDMHLPCSMGYSHTAFQPLVWQLVRPCSYPTAWLGTEEVWAWASGDPAFSPAKRGTWELCTGENSILRDSLGSWDYQETQATWTTSGKRSHWVGKWTSWKPES